MGLFPDSRSNTPNECASPLFFRFRYHGSGRRHLTLIQLPPAILKTLCEAMTWCSSKPFRSPVIDPSAILNVPEWSRESEPIAAWSSRQRDAYRRAIPWINEARSEHLKSTKSETYDPVDVISNCKLLIYECQETVEDGASEAASLGFYDRLDAPPWDTWVSYRDGAVFCCVPNFAISRAQNGIDANPVDCIHWADWSRLNEDKGSANQSLTSSFKPKRFKFRRIGGR